MKKRLFSILTALTLCLSLLPAAALAASDPENYVFDISEGSVIIEDGSTEGTVKVTFGSSSVDNIDPSQVITVTGSYTGTGTTNYETGHNLVVKTSTPVTIKARDLTINNAGFQYCYAMALEVANANVTLILEGENNFTGGKDKGGIVVNAGSTLTIAGTGSVTAKGGVGNGGAGIGGDGGRDCGTIIINGGTVKATGGQGGAGIGGGTGISGGGAGGIITINGGNITATGSNGAAGIGGGSGASRHGTLSTGEGGTAVIFASSISDQSGKDNNTWSGIIFEDNAGKVYGTQTLAADLTIPEGKTLTVPAGTTLTIPKNVTLTNNGIITNNGTIANGGTITGTVDGNQTIQVISATYLNADGAIKEHLASQLTNETITWSEGWYVAKGDITINNIVTLSGDVHLILADGCDLIVNGGIQGAGNLNIYGQSEGTGQLTATGSTVGNKSYGIYVNGGSVTINGGKVTATGGTVNATGGASGISYGIYASNGSITISGGTVNATGGMSDMTVGISSASLTINGGVVTATGGNSVHLSAGISSDALTITDGDITATSGGGNISCGIYAYGDITINGGTVNATSDGRDISCGIYAYDALTINDGVVTATGGVDDISYGLYASGSLAINGGTVTGTGGDGNMSYGIYAFNTLTISGTAEVTATGGMASEESFGLYAGGSNITISGGSLLAQSLSSAGLRAAVSGNMTLNDSHWRTSSTGAFTQGNFKLGAEPYTYLEISDHTPGNWVSNSTQHWKACTDCEAELDKADHTFSGSTCTVCGYTKPSDGSSSGGSSSSTTTKTEKNPDGSTTTTVTDKTTGTVTETTKNTDGSTTVVETKKDGTVTETVKSADGTTGTVVTDSSGEVAEVKASVSSAAVTEAAKSGDAVTLPVEVPSAKTTGDAPTVEISVPKSTGSVKVEIPVGKVTPGTVAVIVHADGTEEIVSTSIPTETGVALTLDGSATVKIVDNAKALVDIHPVSHWAEDAVDFVVARGMFAGTSETTFSPNSPMTRAMLMTVLARFDGEDTSGGSVWYEKGMEWAKANGVSDGSNPDAPITREQLATMLWRYAGSPTSSHSLDGYTDADEISGYALEAMRWANEKGIINGYGNGLLGVTDNATRAQVAQMLMNFVKCLNQ